MFFFDLLRVSMSFFYFLRMKDCHLKKYVTCGLVEVEEFRYLGTTLTNKNSIQEEIKSRLKLLLLFGTETFVFQKVKDHDI